MAKVARPGSRGLIRINRSTARRGRRLRALHQQCADIVTQHHERAAREPAEFAKSRIPGACNVPRGVLEQACQWHYDETVPALAGDCVRPIVAVQAERQEQEAGLVYVCSRARSTTVTSHGERSGLRTSVLATSAPAVPAPRINTFFVTETRPSRW